MEPESTSSIAHFYFPIKKLNFLLIGPGDLPCGRMFERAQQNLQNRFELANDFDKPCFEH
jgi:hypothetical protein